MEEQRISVHLGDHGLPVCRKGWKIRNRPFIVGKTIVRRYVFKQTADGNCIFKGCHPSSAKVNSSKLNYLLGSGRLNRFLGNKSTPVPGSSQYCLEQTCFYSQNVVLLTKGGKASAGSIRCSYSVNLLHCIPANAIGFPAKGYEVSHFLLCSKYSYGFQLLCLDCTGGKAACLSKTRSPDSSRT